VHGDRGSLTTETRQDAALEPPLVIFKREIQRLAGIDMATA
jgi:hypothetical protein